MDTKDTMDTMDTKDIMDTDEGYCKICDCCLCEMLNDPEIKISPNVFHNNICSYHYKYCKIYNNEKIMYNTKGRNFFVDLIEYNIMRHKIRDATVPFLINYLDKYYGNT